MGRGRKQTAQADINAAVVCLLLGVTQAHSSFAFGSSKIAYKTAILFLAAPKLRTRRQLCFWYLQKTAQDGIVVFGGSKIANKTAVLHLVALKSRNVAFPPQMSYFRTRNG